MSATVSLPEYFRPINPYTLAMVFVGLGPHIQFHSKKTHTWMGFGARNWNYIYISI